MNAAENSLKRLDTDHIDIYLVHSFDLQTPLEETISALDELVRMGKVRYVGCCNFAAWQVCKALWVTDRINATPFMCVQNPYNLMDRHLEKAIFGLGMMVYSPLAVGLLIGIYQLDQPPPDGSLWATFQHERYEEATRETPAKVITTVHELALECGKTRRRWLSHGCSPIRRLGYRSPAEIPSTVTQEFHVSGVPSGASVGDSTHPFAVDLYKIIGTVGHLHSFDLPAEYRLLEYNGTLDIVRHKLIPAERAEVL